MKIFILTLIGFCCLEKTYGQGDSKNTHNKIEIIATKLKKRKKPTTDINIYSLVVEKDSIWIKRLEENILQYIKVGRQVKKGKHIIILKFILSKDGHFSDIICEGDPGFNICPIAVRAIVKSPKWIPSVQQVEFDQ